MVGLFGCWQNVCGLNAVCIYVGAITGPVCACVRVPVCVCACVRVCVCPCVRVIYLYLL